MSGHIRELMDKGQIAKFYEWADNRIKTALEGIDQDLWKSSSSEGRDLRKLLEHFVNSYDYLGYKGDFRERMEYLAEISDTSLLGEWEKAKSVFLHHLENLKKDKYQLPLEDGSSITVDTNTYMLNFTDHLSYHRGQIMAKIRDLGGSPKGTDFYTFLSENHKKN